jgi:DNA (cytosine-5)-methyltransferase 1
MFPIDGCVPYHIYWKVLNAKDYGVPQNRERVFIVGIRDDKDSFFNFPKVESLTKRLKDVLEPEVEEKYYLSEKMIEGFTKHSERHKEKGTGFTFEPKNKNDIANCLRANAALCPTDNTIIEEPKIIQLNNPTHSNDRIYSSDGLSPTLNTMQGGNRQPFIEEPKICAMRGRNIENPKSRKSGQPTQQMIEVNENGVSNSLTTVQKDNLVVEPYILDNTMGFENESRKYYTHSPAIRAGRHGLETISQSRIRKLTPIECFRLMDFPDSLVDNARKAGVSDSQLYKQAGNSIVVAVLEKIIKNLKL